MELSSTSIKRILIFAQKKAFLIFFQEKGFVIFPETEPFTLHQKLRKLTPLENSYFFKKKAFIFPEMKIPQRKL